MTSATQDRADDAADRARDSLGLQKPHAVYQKFACELLAAWRSGNDEAGRTLLCELGHLSSHIRNVRDEIASMSLSELQDHSIPTASDQLEEVVKMTEQATTRIMDIAESLEAAVDEDEPNLQEKLRQATTAIYEACNFQDITGPRVRKVVRALQTIESRIDALLWALSGDGGDGRQQRATHGSDGCAANVPGDLLEGPQLPGKGNSQADVDALFDL